MDWLTNVFSSVWFVFLLLAFFGLTIFVHELGHYLVARWLGLVVETFSIGFGPAIWQRTYGGIVYKIGIFPVGGYVALPQLDPTGMSRIQGSAADAGGQTELPTVAPWRKIAVSVAGAVGNILFAILLAWIVYWVGMPAGPAERSSVVGYVARDSASYAAGMREGDTVLSVNGRPVGKWSDLRMEAAFHEEAELRIRTKAGEERTIRIKTENGVFGEHQVPGIDGPGLCMVLRATPGMPAAAAGIKVDDVIVSFDGQPVYSPGHMIDLVRAAENRAADLVVKRRVAGKEQQVTLSMIPVRDAESDMVRIGIEFNLRAVEEGTIVRPRPMEQLRTHATAIFRFLEALGTPKEAKAASKAVGGPVAILVSYWYIVKTSPMLAIWFTGFLNVNLAILNLLPMPVLDGGHICFSLYEMVRRKPMNARFVNALVNVFAVLLISLILLISVRDMDRFTPVGKLVRGLFTSEQKPQDPVYTNTAPINPAPAE